MAARLIDGKAIAEQIHAETSAAITRLQSQHNLTPGLAVILVGDNPASAAYVASKDKMCTRLGIHSLRINLPADTGEGSLLAKISDLNFDRTIHGILVQSPLPAHLNEDVIFSAIDPTKDVDGFHPLNVGKLALGDETGLVPCTPAGIHQLLVRSGIALDGVHVVVLGRSRIVGRPVSLILSQKNVNATVTLCHSRTRNLPDLCRSANILIAAIGRPKFVTADMVHEGAVVIDVGINRVAGQLIGDVDFDAVADKASLITPVPGGVGPMTIAMLMHNTVRAAKLRSGVA
jgi:methylenetetrahydrofolate dehydrogenase (NADP+) / methenyltetrahydrofolate cyclohydrolase